MTVRPIAFGLFLAAGLLPAVLAAADPAPTPAPAATTAVDVPVDPNDLGRGLRYFRATSLADDLAALEPALADGPLVLDLRAAQGDAASITRLQELMKERAAGATARPLLVLLAAGTPCAIQTAVPTAPGVVTLGCAAPGFAPAVAVSTDSAHDNAAIAALAAGRPVRGLIEEKSDKPRFDEAHLARNHANGHRNNDATDPAATPSTKDKPADAPEPEAPVKDLVLQRAVFLHRALLALGRLPQKD